MRGTRAALRDPRWWAPRIVGLAFVVAAATKLARPAPALEVLVYLFPDLRGHHLASTSTLAAAVCAEMALGFGLMWRPTARCTALMAVLALTGLTAMLFTLMASPASPACGCFGTLVAPEHARADHVLGVLRNACLAWLLGPVLRPTPLRPHAETSRTHLAWLKPRAARAFTIVELLIVVGVIGLLVGIALPALKHARVKAAETRNLATHRSLISALLSYSIDHDGRFPFLGTPGDPAAPVVAWGYPSEYSFFSGQSFLWLCTLVPEYFDLRNEQVDVALANPFGVPHPGLPNAPPEVFQTAFLLTQTAFAQPRFWSLAQEPLPELCTPTRWKDVQFPAMKGITLDRHLVTLMELSDHVGLGSVGMGDGSASIRPTAPPGWQDRVVSRPYGAWPALIMATRDGLAGRDY